MPHHDLPPRVSVLYVDPTGPYFALPEVDAWDADRDARSYRGKLPVVAHPACGPWGNFAWNCTLQDPEDALHAIQVVRRNGGVLEHPKNSRLWKKLGLPKPGEPMDVHGGWTLEIHQHDFGHRALKPTWLYFVGVEEEDLPPMPRPRKERPATGHASSVMMKMSKRTRRLTPPALAKWLVEAVKHATGSRVSGRGGDVAYLRS